MAEAPQTEQPRLVEKPQPHLPYYKDTSNGVGPKEFIRQYPEQAKLADELVDKAKTLASKQESESEIDYQKRMFDDVENRLRFPGNYKDTNDDLFLAIQNSPLNQEPHYALMAVEAKRALYLQKENEDIIKSTQGHLDRLFRRDVKTEVTHEGEPWYVEGDYEHYFDENQRPKELPKTDLYAFTLVADRLLDISDPAVQKAGETKTYREQMKELENVMSDTNGAREERDQAGRKLISLRSQFYTMAIEAIRTVDQPQYVNPDIETQLPKDKVLTQMYTQLKAVRRLSVDELIMQYKGVNKELSSKHKNEMQQLLFQQKPQLLDFALKGADLLQRRVSFNPKAKVHDTPDKIFYKKFVQGPGESAEQPPAQPITPITETPLVPRKKDEEQPDEPNPKTPKKPEKTPSTPPYGGGYYGHEGYQSEVESFTLGITQKHTLESLQRLLQQRPDMLHTHTKIVNPDKTITWVDENGELVKRNVEGERQAIQKYLAEMKTNSAAYHSYIEQLTALPTMQQMENACRVSVNIPAWMEGKTLYGMLEQYVQQVDEQGAELDSSLFEINILVNRKTGTLPDNSVTEIQRFIEDQKAKGKNYHINFADVEFDPPLNNVGNARKVLTDITLIRSLNRDNQTKQLYIESEDADLEQIDRKTVINIINKFDQNPHLDAAFGIQDRFPEELMKNDFLFVSRRVWSFAESLLEHRRYRPENNPNWSYNWNRVATSGWNTAYTAEAIALIGGYNSNLAVGEDQDVGEKITMIRGDGKMPNLDVVGRLPTRTDSSPRRFIGEIITGKPAYSDTFSNEEVNTMLRTLSPEQLQQKIDYFSRLNEKNAKGFLGMFNGYLRFFRKQTPDEQSAREMNNSILFWLGFKKSDYEYNDKGELVVKNWDNLKTALERYRTQHARPRKFGERSTHHSSEWTPPGKALQQFAEHDKENVVSAFNRPYNLSELQASTDTLEEGSYVICLDKPLGSGYMGTVVTGYDKNTGELVAVKRVKKAEHEGVASANNFPSGISDPEDYIKTRVTNPTIRIYKNSFDHGNEVIKIYPLASVDLDTYLKQAHTMDAQTAVAMTIKITEALRDLHQVGVLDLDVKPSNILFDEKGKLYLTDFDAVSIRNNVTNEYKRGWADGPFEVFPPELFKANQPLSESTDTYEMCAVLYKSLTGKYPYDTGAGTRDEQKQRLQQAHTAGVFEIPDSVPESLRPILKKGISPNPVDRYQTAGELLQDLRHAYDQLQTAAPFTPTPTQIPAPPQPASPPQLSTQETITETGRSGVAVTENLETTVDIEREKIASWEDLKRSVRFSRARAEGGIETNEPLWNNVSQIRDIVRNSDVIKNGLPVYYPGSMADIPYALGFTDGTKFVFVDYVYIDQDGNLNPNTLPDGEITDIGGHITNVAIEGTLGEGGKRVVTFEWGGKERTITMYAEDATKFAPDELKDGTAFIVIKAPTPFGRTTKDEGPGHILRTETQGAMLNNLAVGGFIHLPPTKVFDPEIIGFEKRIDSPGERNGWPLYQKTREQTQVAELLQLDRDIETIDIIRNGRYLGEINANTLTFFEEHTEELRGRYLSLSPKNQTLVLPIIQRLLTHPELTTELQDYLIKNGREYGITDQASAERFLQGTITVALDTFPEINEQKPPAAPVIPQVDETKNAVSNLPPELDVPPFLIPRRWNTLSPEIRLAAAKAIGLPHGVANREWDQLSLVQQSDILQGVRAAKQKTATPVPLPPSLQ